jgi:tRNA threonylcarbamoyladenosine biosynthesis protein TsaB
MMDLILNIDTALDIACISLAADGQVLLSATNGSTKDHAAWIQAAINKLVRDAGYELHDLKAVAVSNGPGSYTGLRIGLSTAKGLCYALNIPLITVGSLEAMAFTAIKDMESPGIPSHDSQPATHNLLFCPMIDARRMEVFAAVYDNNLNEVIKPHARILDHFSFEELLKRQKILFLGNGSIKFHQICQNPHAIFKNYPLNAAAVAGLTYKNFIGNNFAGLAYTEPLYLKEFFTTKANGPEKD